MYKNFRKKLSLKSLLVILKEDLFRVNVQLRQITELQDYFKSLVGLRLLLIVYLMH